MKLRIQGNTLRLRLSMPEVDALNDHQAVEERVDFGSQTFRYILQPAEHWGASFENDCIRIHLPTNLIPNWANTDQVGLEYQKPVGESNILSVIVEKDFKCLSDRPGEEHNFPHPKEGIVKC